MLHLIFFFGSIPVETIVESENCLFFLSLSVVRIPCNVVNMYGFDAQSDSCPSLSVEWSSLAIASRSKKPRTAA